MLRLLQYLVLCFRYCDTRAVNQGLPQISWAAWYTLLLIDGGVSSEGQLVSVSSQLHTSCCGYRLLARRALEELEQHGMVELLPVPRSQVQRLTLSDTGRFALRCYQCRLSNIALTT